jgi:hypothetical protein
MDDRETVKVFFKSWIKFYEKRKDKWADALKKRFLLRRLRLNRLYQAWRKRTKILKIKRIKIEIIRNKNN